jgi:hypothetical protein
MSDDHRRVGETLRNACDQIGNQGTEPAGHKIVLQVLADVAEATPYRTSQTSENIASPDSP